MTRLTFFTPRPRALRVVLACVALPLLCSAVHALTVTMTGNPAPPTTVTINVPYDVTIQAVPSSGYFIQGVTLYSCSGTASAPTGTWAVKAFYSTFSHTCDATVQKTFNVVNQASGYYWWYGSASEFDCAGTGSFHSADSAYLGYYYTL